MLRLQLFNFPLELVTPFSNAFLLFLFLDSLVSYIILVCTLQVAAHGVSDTLDHAYLRSSRCPQVPLPVVSGVRGIQTFLNLRAHSKS
jgi:hypothetical protein